MILFLGTNHHLGEGLYLSPGQLGTLQCITKTQKWTFTVRKLIMMLFFSDSYLQDRCGVGKKISKHEAMNFE